MSTTWPVRDRLTIAACPMIRPCLQYVLPGRHDELRRVVADDSHERGRERLHQLPARSRLLQQQAEHVHLLVATRLLPEQFEQHRQLRPVLPSSRGRRRAVRTRHQRVCDIHSTFHTRGRRRRTTDIANAPFWRWDGWYVIRWVIRKDSRGGAPENLQRYRWLPRDHAAITKEH